MHGPLLLPDPIDPKGLISVARVCERLASKFSRKDGHASQTLARFGPALLERGFVTQVDLSADPCAAMVLGAVAVASVPLFVRGDQAAYQFASFAFEDRNPTFPLFLSLRYGQLLLCRSAFAERSLEALMEGQALFVGAAIFAAVTWVRTSESERRKIAQGIMAAAQAAGLILTKQEFRDQVAARAFGSSVKQVDALWKEHAPKKWQEPGRKRRS